MKFDMKRIVALIMVLCMALTLCSCGKRTYVEDETGVKTYLLTYDDEITLENFPKADNALDVDKIYESIEYIPQMFYGQYELNNMEEELADFASKVSTQRLEYYYEYGEEIRAEICSTLPCRIEAGVTDGPYRLRNDRSHNWATLYFSCKSDEKYYEQEVICSFEVEGNTITFTPLDYYHENRDESGKYIGCEYKIGEDSLTYAFSFSGPNLTLSTDSESVTLIEFSFSENTGSGIRVGGYKAKTSKSINGLDHFSGDDYGKGDTGVFYTLIDEPEDLYIDKRAIKLSTDGLLTLTWTEVNHKMKLSETYTHQFVYFTSGDGCVLVDENGIYDYSESFGSRQQQVISEGLTLEELAMLTDLTDSDLEKIAKMKEGLLTSLTTAFEEKGITAKVDLVTGEVALDDTVLFALDEYELLDGGKEFLDKFLEAYSSVINDEQYKDVISKIMVEGHTDTDGTEEHNKELSTNRANAVKDYCISIDSSIEPLLNAVGYAAEKPVYDADGNVDMAASRRVSFRFILNLKTLLDL